MADELNQILHDGVNKYEEELQINRERENKLREKNLLPEGFSLPPLNYEALVQPEDPNVAAEELVLQRYQARMPNNKVAIVWDYGFDKQGNLVSTIGNTTDTPNDHPTSRSGIVLIGPKKEDGGLPTGVAGE